MDVDRLLSGLSDLLRRTLGDRIGLDVVLSDAPWFTWADMTQMENALLSLAVNARDQVRNGEKLTIAVSNVHLDGVFAAAHPAVPPGDYIQIAVSDSAGTNEPKDWLPADDLNSADLSMARAFVREAGGFLLRSDPAARRTVAAAFPAALRAAGTHVDGCAPRYRRPGDDPDGGGRRGGARVLRPDAAETRLRGAGGAGRDGGVPVDRGSRRDRSAVHRYRPAGRRQRPCFGGGRDRNVDAGIRVLFTTGHERVDLPDHANTALLLKPFTAAQLAAMVRDVLAAQPSPERLGAERLGPERLGPERLGVVRS